MVVLLMAVDPLEKKLDTYYEDLMSKLIELVDMQKVLLGEQKELKKDFAKMKEHVLEHKTYLDRIDTRLENMKATMTGFKAGGGSGFKGGNADGSQMSSPAVPSFMQTGGAAAPQSPAMAAPAIPWAAASGADLSEGICMQPPKAFTQLHRC